MAVLETGLYKLAVEGLDLAHDEAARAHALEIGWVHIQVYTVDVTHPVRLKTPLKDCDRLFLPHLVSINIYAFT